MQQERAQDLRRAIDRLPLMTRRAMQRGIEKHRIIVGADANLTGLCPIMAAAGSASQVGRPFARAWDRYARARLPRAATERELLALRSMLDASIEADQHTPPFPLQAALASHRLAQRRNRPPQPQATPRQAAEDARDAARQVRHALRDMRQAARSDVEVPAPPARDVRSEPETPREVRYSAADLMPAARVAAVKAKAKARAQAEAQARAEVEAEAQARAAAARHAATAGDREQARELAACERTGERGSWLRPARRYNEYERALLDLERELEAVEREADSALDELALTSGSGDRP